MPDISLFANMPFVVGASIIIRDNGKRFSFPLHNHDDYSEFLLIIDGEGSFRIDGKQYVANGGKVLCYNRSIWHEEKSTSERFQAMYIGFRGLQMRDLPPDFFLAKEQSPIIDLEEHFVPIKQLFYEIIMEFHNTAPESITISTQLLGVLMCRLSQIVYYKENDHFKKRPSQRAVLIAKRYIEENYQTDITLKTLAKLTHLDPYHFSHLFKQETGLSPIQHLIHYRVEVAKQYLISTPKSMNEIAELVGYSSETYFQNIFKKVTGIAPGRYRSGYTI